MPESVNRRAVEFRGILCMRRNVRQEPTQCVGKNESNLGELEGFSIHSLDRAWRLGRQGREFESPRPDKNKREQNCSRLFFYCDYVLCLHSSKPKDEQILHWIDGETRRADERAQCRRV